MYKKVKMSNQAKNLYRESHVILSQQTQSRHSIAFLGNDAICLVYFYVSI